MIIRNSIKTLLRMKKRCAVFFILLFAAALFVTVGLNMITSIDDMKTDAAKNLPSTVAFGYAGYDKAQIKDALSAFDPKTVSSVPGVSSVFSSRVYRGSYKGISERTADEAYRYYTVISVTHMSPYDNYNGGYEISVDESGNIIEIPTDGRIYHATMTRCFYRCYSKETYFITVDMNGFDYKPEYGKTYIMHGVFAGSTKMHFKVLGLDALTDEVEGIKTAEFPPCVDITDRRTEFYNDKESVYMKLADAYERLNYSFVSVLTPDLSSYSLFFRKELYITDGRAFTPADNRVCVMPEAMMQKAGLKIGDVIDVTFFEDINGLYGDLFFANKTGTYEKYTIVGAFRNNEATAGTVFFSAPAATDITTADKNIFMQAMINGDGDDAVFEQIKKSLPDNFTAEMFDGGYELVAESIDGMSESAAIILFVSVPAGIAVIFMFSFLFVYKQRDSVDIMISLGAGKNRVLLYLLSGSGILCATASVTGAVGAGLISRAVIRFIYSTQVANAADSLRYSAVSSAIMPDYIPNVSVNILLCVISALALIALCMIFCGLFAAVLIKKRKPKKKKVKASAPKKPAKSSGMRGGALKFAVLSIRRGGTRSLIVPAVCLVFSLFLCVVFGLFSSLNADLQALNDSYKITGEVTSHNGQFNSSLIVSEQTAQKLEDSGYITPPVLSYVNTFKFSRISFNTNGSETGASSQVRFPTFNTFAYENFVAACYDDPDINYTDDISTSQEFNTESPIIEYAEGFSAEDYKCTPPDTLYWHWYIDTSPVQIIIVSEQFAEEHGITPGQTIDIYISNVFVLRQFKVIGIIKNAPIGTSIYTPLDNTVFISNHYVYENAPFHGTFNCCLFEVKDTSKLASFREYLKSEGYSQVKELGRLRTFIRLYDGEYLATSENITRSIGYFKALFVLLLVVVTVFGFIISYLMVNHRKSEYAVMRSMGTGRVQCFMSFFSEQFILCSIGALTGLLLWLPFGALSLLTAVGIAGFILCYMLGAAVSVLMLGKGQVMEILTDRNS